MLASVHPRAVDGLLADLQGLGVADGEVTLMRVETLGRASGGDGRGGPRLGGRARPGRAQLPADRALPRVHVAAGVIACYGVVDVQRILIVGAMAISPDLLPITAVGVGLVDRRLRLAGRALFTLVVGMAFASAAAAASTFAQDGSAGSRAFNIDATVLGGLTDVNNETIVVALAAGVAGMLALETRASSGVGVAVSVDDPGRRVPRRGFGTRRDGRGYGRPRRTSRLHA